MKRVLPLLVVLLLACASRVSAASFVVDSTADTADPTPEGVCSSPCTLREAIQEANRLTDADSISFDIAGAVGTVRTILIASGLPTIFNPVTIDGYTQPGAKANINATGGLTTTILIEINGNNVASGLSLDTANCTLSGLAINRMNGAGLSLSGNGTRIEGCFIGTDALGTTDLGNTGFGIKIDQSTGITIGGTTAAARNVISGNNGGGVDIFGFFATGNMVQGNLIGVNAAGAALGNTGAGVTVSGRTNTIGGTAVGAGNVISGNTGNGVTITSNATGNMVQGNVIGLNPAGTTAMGNGGDGVHIDPACDTNTVGGTSAAARNVMSGNGGNGAFIGGNSNNVQSNLIGTNAGGTGAVPNALAGVRLDGGNNNIGGDGAAFRNVISGNTQDGVFITSGGNKVQGNFIGTNALGTAALSNGDNGVEMTGVQDNLIGGTTMGQGNVISGNANSGVLLLSGTGQTRTTIQGNRIGTDLSGTAAVPNATGITIFGSSVTIGGLGQTSPPGNLISGNTGDGILLSGGNAIGVTIQSNRIGTNLAGTAALPNGDDGIDINGPSNGINLIGGPPTPTPAGNTIAFNVGDGIVVTAGDNNTFRANRIFSNDGQGIDLGDDGVTPNDETTPQFDIDPGANGLQNFPIITSVVGNVISATLKSAPNTPFRVEFFASDARDPSGHGEGQFYLGSVDTTTDGAGNAPTFTFTSLVALAGTFVSATATVLSTTAPANTSEFSRAVSVPARPQNVSLSPPGTVTNAPGETRTFRATYSDANGFADIRYAYLQIGTNDRFGLKVAYDRNANRLYLLSDSGGRYLGGFAPGSANAISNTHGTLNGATTTVVASGDTLQIDWSLTPLAPLALTPNGSGATPYPVQLRVTDRGGLSDGFDQGGSWIISGNQAPTNVSLSPNGTVTNSVGQTRTFRATYSDPNGFTNIRYAYLQVKTGSVNVLGAAYDVLTNKLYLLNNAGNSYGTGYAPGTVGSLSNSQGSLNVGATVATAPNATTLQIDWVVSASSPLAGASHPVLLFVQDRGRLTDGFDRLATWTIASSP